MDEEIFYMRRYGIKWNGPREPIATEMADG